jgi:hypothetical protein
MVRLSSIDKKYQTRKIEKNFLYDSVCLSQSKRERERERESVSLCEREGKSLSVVVRVFEKKKRERWPMIKTES